MKHKADQLAPHALVLAVLDHTMPILIRSAQKTFHPSGFNKNEMFKVTVSERYHLDVFESLTSLLNVMSKLEECRRYTARFPSPKSFQKAGITRHSWLEYHYSYHIVLVVSVFDISLIAVNNILRLGNLERNCKSEMILCNRNVVNCGLVGPLNHLDTFIKKFREMRNSHVHRGKKPRISQIIKSDALDNAEIIQLADSFPPNYARSGMSHIVDSTVKGEVKKLVIIMESDFDNLYDRVNTLLNALKPIYDAMSKVQ